MIRRRVLTRALALLALSGIVAVGAAGREKRFGYCSVQNTGARSLGCTVEVFVTGTLSHPSNGIFSDNLGTPLANPFTANATSGLWAFYADNARYDVTFSGGNPSISPSYTLSDYLFLDLDGTTPLTANAFISSTANAASVGTLRLASTDLLTWRNSANTFDWGLRVTPASGNYPESLVWQNLPSDTGIAAIVAGAFIQDGGVASVATTGAFRMHSGDLVCWRNNANTTDLCLAKNGSDQFTLAGPLLPFNVTSPNAVASTGGFLNLGNADLIRSDDGIGGSVAMLGMSGSTPVVAGFRFTAGQITPSTVVPFTLVAPNASGANGPNITIQAGSASSGTSFSGGNVNIVAGNGTSFAGLGGNITLTPGAGPVIAKGIVQVAAGFFFNPPAFTFGVMTGGAATPTNGALVYCSDCTIANPCASGGTGAIAKRLNNMWVCN